VAVAMYDYESQAEEELSFKEGAVLLVLDDSDQDWWYVICILTVCLRYPLSLSLSFSLSLFLSPSLSHSFSDLYCLYESGK
jgi:hypothetical protein